MKKQEIKISLPSKAVNTKDKKIINNNLTILQKHLVSKAYLILSKNDFGKNERHNIGYFNKKTNFIVSNEKSLYLIDKDLNFFVPGIDIEPLDELIKNKKINNFYLLYSIPATNISSKDKIYKIIFENKIISLNYKIGFNIGSILNKLIIHNKKWNEIKKYFSQKDLEIFNLLINNFGSESDPKFEIKIPELIHQINEKFIYGFFAGLSNLGQDKIVFNNFNIYHITGFLNYLGASYSIRLLNNKFHVRYKFPATFVDQAEIFQKNLDFQFRLSYYVIEDNKIIKKKFKNLQEILDFKNNFNIKKSNNLIDQINTFKTLLIPTKDLVFIEQKNVIAYDFVSTQEENYNNYFLPGQPLLKNSDGDILAVIAIDTPEAAKQADEKFSIFVKNNHLSYLTGKVNNWIGHDAVLGLYNFTK